MTYTRNGIGYNSEDEANLAAEIPSVYLDRPFDAGHIAEAVIASDWLAEYRRQVIEECIAELGRGFWNMGRDEAVSLLRALIEKGADR